MINLKLLECLRPKCDAIWLRDVNSIFDQYVDAYWRRPIKDGEEAFLCQQCYARVQDIIARREVRELQRKADGSQLRAEGAGAVGKDQALPPSPPTWEG